MTIRRGERPADNFTIIANGFLRDARLSFKARGIGAYLLSHAEGFRSTTASIAKANGCGLDQVRAGLQELEQHGYLHRERQRDETGHNTDTDYLITDQPGVDPIYGRETQRRETQRRETQRREVPRGETPLHKKTKGLEDQLTKPANAGLADASSSGLVADDDQPPLLAGLEPPADGHRGRAKKPRAVGNAGAAGGDDPSVTAQSVTAAWVDAYRDAHQGVQPTRSLIGRVSRCAKELLNAGNDPARVAGAARSAGRQGWATIDRELARLASGQPTSNGFRGHVPYHDPEDMSVYTTEIR